MDRDPRHGPVGKVSPGSSTWAPLRVFFLVWIFLPSCLGLHLWEGPPRRLEWTSAGRSSLEWPRQLRDVRGACHCHSLLSHDSEGSWSRIARSARRAGVEFVLLTDHPSPDFIERSPRGMFEGVWLIGGGELRTGGHDGSLLAVGVKRTPEPRSDCAAIIDSIHAEGGVAIVGHAEEFTAFDVPGYDGIEIQNLHAAVRDRFPVTTLLGGLFLPPPLFFRYLIPRPDGNLDRYGRLLDQGRRLTVVAGADAHENIQLLGWRIGTYAETFKAASTHLLIDGEVSDLSIMEALQRGRAYAAFESLSATDGFVFVGRSPGEPEAVPGDFLSLAPGTCLSAVAPGNPKFVLRRGSQVVASVCGSRLDFNPQEPGLYWLEVFQEGRCWIVTSPLAVTGELP